MLTRMYSASPLFTRMFRLTMYSGAGVAVGWLCEKVLPWSQEAASSSTAASSAAAPRAWTFGLSFVAFIHLALWVCWLRHRLQAGAFDALTDRHGDCARVRRCFADALVGALAGNRRFGGGVEGRFGAGSRCWCAVDGEGGGRRWSRGRADGRLVDVRPADRRSRYPSEIIREV